MKDFCCLLFVCNLEIQVLFSIVVDSSEVFVVGIARFGILFSPRYV